MKIFLSCQVGRHQKWVRSRSIAASDLEFGVSECSNIRGVISCLGGWGARNITPRLHAGRF